MRWWLVNPKACVIVKILIVFSTLPYQAWCLDEKRLWLPTQHQKLYLSLKDAALAAESLDRCVDVLRGTIDMEQSRPDNPIFRILCRQENGRTYNEMVDGNTSTTLTTKIEIPKELTAEEIEAQRLAEEKRIEEEQAKRKADHWSICNRLFTQKTHLMKNLERLDGDEPLQPAKFNDTKTEFVINFDAKDFYGALLHYTATCTIGQETQEILIRSRKD